MWKDDKISQGKVAKVYTHMGLKKVEVDEASAGDIIEVAGLPNIHIGDTICDFNNPEKYHCRYWWTNSIYDI